MGGLSVTSVLDLQLSSEDEEYNDEITMMAQYVEVELSALIPVLGPSTSKIHCTNNSNGRHSYVAPS